MIITLNSYAETLGCAVPGDAPPWFAMHCNEAGMSTFGRILYGSPQAPAVQKEESATKTYPGRENRWIVYPYRSVGNTTTIPFNQCPNVSVLTTPFSRASSKSSVRAIPKDKQYKIDRLDNYQNRKFQYHFSGQSQLVDNILNQLRIHLGL